MSLTIGPALAIEFMLIFARVGALIMLLPGFSQNGVSTRIRLGFALLLTLILLPTLPSPLPEGASPDALGSVVMKRLFIELLIGLSIGLIVRLVLLATSVAGATISNQMGLGMAQAVDPTQGIQGALFANFLGVLAATLVFATDLHHIALMAVHDSYDLMPVGMIPEPGDIARLATEGVSNAFTIGIRIAAPFLVFGLVFYVGLGVLSRLMPQVQIFFIAMPASILLGIALFSVTLLVMMQVYHAHLESVIRQFIAG